MATIHDPGLYFRIDADSEQTEDTLIEACFDFDIDREAYHGSCLVCTEQLCGDREEHKVSMGFYNGTMTDRVKMRSFLRFRNVDSEVIVRIFNMRRDNQIMCLGAETRIMNDSVDG